MADSVADKKHAATGKRLAQLRRQGSTLRSRDLASGLVLFISVIMCVTIIWKLTEELQQSFHLIYFHVGDVLTHDYSLDFISQCVHGIFLSLIPLFIAVLLTALLSPFLFGGWNFTFEVLQFKPEKFNVFANLSSLFSKRTLINVATSMIKTGLILTFLFVFLRYHKELLVNLIHEDHESAIAISANVAKNFIIGLCVVVMLIMMMDTIYHYFDFFFRNMMTNQEVKDEYREAEGNPEVKRKIKSMQLSMIRQRLRKLIPQATVVVTNPTHYAVALRYDVKKDKAPRVIAKGKDFIAQQIRELAVEHAITLYESPPLARALYKTTKLNAEIRTELYMAVAIVLSYVQQLKSYQQGFSDYPVKAADLKIPNNFIFKD